jgi:hypothetical protein
VLRRRICLSSGAAPPPPESRAKIYEHTRSAGKGVAHRGNKGPFGMGLSSKSVAIFAAAWKPCMQITPVSQSVFLSALSGHPAQRVTHLDPIHDGGNVGSLQQKLLSLHADADHIPPLHVVAGQPTFCVVQGVRLHEVLFLGLRHRGVVDPEVSPLDTRRAMCAW